LHIANAFLFLAITSTVVSFKQMNRHFAANSSFVLPLVQSDYQKEMIPENTVLNQTLTERQIYLRP
jgi:hypothetical protein